MHTCNDRLWYVHGYLMPSLMNQGISQDDIVMYRDINNDGCLQSFVKSIDYLPDDGYMWHLQDDVLICSDFKDRTKQHYDTDLVCGFASKYDKQVKPGKYNGIDNIWYSFPCIRINNSLLKHFSIWFNSSIQNDNRYREWLKSNKHDDLLFRYFLKNYYKGIKGTNLAPNLVEHIDWLLGGSIVNKQRGEIIRSVYWENEELVEKLKKNLTNISKHDTIIVSKDN